MYHWAWHPTQPLCLYRSKELGIGGAGDGGSSNLSRQHIEHEHKCISNHAVSSSEFGTVRNTRQMLQKLTYCTTDHIALWGGGAVKGGCKFETFRSALGCTRVHSVAEWGCRGDNIQNARTNVSYMAHQKNGVLHYIPQPLSPSPPILPSGFALLSCTVSTHSECSGSSACSACSAPLFFLASKPPSLSLPLGCSMLPVSSLDFSAPPCPAKTSGRCCRGCGSSISNYVSDSGVSKGAYGDK